MALTLELVRKTKKNEPKIFPILLAIDREAFGKIDDQVFILKTFWKSQCNKILIARNPATQGVLGYACFVELDGGCYLMRIGVRIKNQRLGVGRQLLDFMLAGYPKLSLEVSSDNEKAVGFYKKVGLELTEYFTTKDGVEFAKFSTPEEAEMSDGSTDSSCKFE